MTATTVDELDAQLMPANRQSQGASHRINKLYVPICTNSHTHQLKAVRRNQHRLDANIIASHSCRTMAAKMHMITMLALRTSARASVYPYCIAVSLVALGPMIIHVVGISLKKGNCVYT